MNHIPMKADYEYRKIDLKALNGEELAHNLQGVGWVHDTDFPASTVDSIIRMMKKRMPPDEEPNVRC